jgi:hypothetical protein
MPHVQFAFHQHIALLALLALLLLLLQKPKVDYLSLPAPVRYEDIQREVMSESVLFRAHRCQGNLAAPTAAAVDQHASSPAA